MFTHLHRHVQKIVSRNPYTVKIIMNVWECDLVDVQGISKFNDGIKYLLSAIDVFSKYLHVVPLIWKTGSYVTVPFQSVLKTADTRNPYAGGLSGCRRIEERNSRTYRFRTC